MADIGIDLGTTNSLIAVFDGEKPELIPNALGNVLTPSVVSVDESGQVIVGEAAKERLVSHATSTVAAFKRLMGTQTVTTLGKQSFRPQELSALILRSLKLDAETHLGTTISKAVISVPAYFNDQQRKATIDAGKLAGLEVERLVNEPTAAALAYGLQSRDEGTFVVLDLGGGTFDVSILEKYDDVMEVKATTGDSKLGGEDFTAVAERLIREKLQKGTDLKTAALRGTLRRQGDLLKHTLSSTQEAHFKITLDDKTHEGVISRDTFERECAGLLQRLRNPVERAIRDSGLASDEIDAVLLVGGATRMQMVKSLFARMFGKLPLVNVPPDTAIGLGAAIQAGLIARRGALKDVVMTDVCPFTLGVATLEDADAKEHRLYVEPIIERNAVVPISRSSVFNTVSNRQKVLQVAVYQGENLRPENNVHLGSIDVPVPPNKAGAEAVDVRFTYDISGVLQVEATVLSTKKTLTKVFQNSSGLSDVEIESRLKALEKLKMHPREQAANKVIVARMERIYEEARGPARDEVRQLIAAFESEISDQRLRNPDACRKHYTEILNSLDLQPGNAE